MEPMSMNDGLDGRETVAFGLAAGEVATLVLALVAAYAAVRSGMPGAIAWCLAAALGGSGTALAWGRFAGRPMLEWAVLLGRFLLRSRRAHVRRARGSAASAVRALTSAGDQGRFAVIPLALRRYGDTPPSQGEAVAAAGGPAAAPSAAAVPAPARGRRSHVVGFFSLNGGSGRTTLAVEAAVLLAVQAGAAAAAGGHRRRIGLADLTERNPTAGLRLGFPLATPTPDGDAAAAVAVHESGLLVGTGRSPSRQGEDPGLLVALEAVERAGAEVVVIDIDCDLGDRCLAALRRSDEVHIVLTPTAGGVLDAYRSTAALRRLGLSHRLRYVVNRCRGATDLGEVMADLGGLIDAEVPQDGAFITAENQHRPVALSGPGAAAVALGNLARAIEDGAAGSRRAPPRWAERDAV